MSRFDVGLWFLVASAVFATALAACEPDPVFWVWLIVLCFLLRICLEWKAKWKS